MIAPMLFPLAGEFQRWPYDPAAARRLMAEAGYAEGFELGMDCPNDRYVNDEEICQAVAAMLSRIGVKVTAQHACPRPSTSRRSDRSATIPPSTCSAGRRARSTATACSPTSVRCRDDDGKGGTFNFGGYCNPRIDALLDRSWSRPTPAKRDELIAEAFRLLHEDVGTIPLHQQSIAWGVSRKINVRAARRQPGPLRQDLDAVAHSRGM